MTPTDEFKLQTLKRGDVVEFVENVDESRFGVVLSGFGMDTYTIGTKIFGVFGATAEEAISNFNSQIEKAKGYTRRSPCKIVSHIDISGGD